MSPEEIKTLVESLGSIIGVLRDADPRDKAAIYANLGMRMTYNPAENKMIVEARPSAIMHEVRVRGANRTRTT